MWVAAGMERGDRGKRIGRPTDTQRDLDRETERQRDRETETQRERERDR